MSRAKQTRAVSRGTTADFMPRALPGCNPVVEEAETPRGEFLLGDTQPNKFRDREKLPAAGARADR
jgi:hypothetical protein